MVQVDTFGNFQPGLSLSIKKQKPNTIKIISNIDLRFVYQIYICGGCWLLTKVKKGKRFLKKLSAEMQDYIYSLR
jgi:hypothetical protein